MLQASITPSDLAAQAAKFDLSDEELAITAKKVARAVQHLASLWNSSGATQAMLMRNMRKLARRHQVELPATVDVAQTLNRICDAAWWRKALRKRFRLVEHRAIQAGAVHCGASPYVSARALQRAERDRRRNAELLASLDAINQTTGEVLPLEALVQQSLANPSNRRKAMMARIKGIEVHAKSKGHEALFFTITCPSRMHRTAGRNERYDGSSPREAQTYLNRVWRKASRKLQHDGVTFYGMRVTEPHHDACPHWHLLAFTTPDEAGQLTETLRAYALCDTPNEPGAAERRFVVKRIDPSQGSAVGYVAKYVSKSIDGEGVDADDETGADGHDAARRVVSWAHLWGVRQFQFFGVPAITPTRELYRLDHLATPSEALGAAHEASKANDYGAWLRACEVHGLRFRVNYTERPSARYAGELTKRIEGITAQAPELPAAMTLVTRSDEWRIEQRGRADDAAGAGVPWTRFTKCAPIDLIEIFGTNDAGLSEEAPLRGRPISSPPGRRRPPGAQHLRDPRGRAAC